MPERRIRIGAAGLGKAFGLMLPTLVRDPSVELMAAADPRSEATRKLSAEFGVRSFDSVAALCADPDVEMVYIATPHQYNAEHAVLAASHGKHVLVEKPMAISLAESRRMIDAARSAGVALIVG